LDGPRCFILSEKENHHTKGDKRMPDSFNNGPNGEFKGEFGPSPRHVHQGQSIEESYGAYYGEQYEQGVYGHQSFSSKPNMEHESGSRSFRRYGSFSGRGPKNYKRSDERIVEDVCERLTENGELDASDITVQVQNAEVTLTGTVEDRYFKRLAEDIVESVSGVKDIHNQIRINRKSSI
jgi:osmotically-inducible protein OsmY